MAEAGRPGLMARVYAWSHRRFPTFIDCRLIQLTQILAEHGFRVTEVTRGSLWGLRLEIALAEKG
jgi:demethylmenaquinone methyltransferase/2-methoxy-6-polyprenyl-1,4-benzoquinol methylase